MIKNKAKKLIVLGTLMAVGAIPILYNQPTIVFDRDARLEDISKRTHTTKDFASSTNPNVRIKIQSSGLLHYYDGVSFKDIENLPFPEGKEITSAKDKHFMLDLPEWGREELSPDKKTVRVYDKSGTSIYIFKKPKVASKGVNIKANENSSTTPEVNYDSADFYVENKKLYFKIPKLEKSEYPLQAYDDVDTTSVHNKDAPLYEGLADNNFGSRGDASINSGVSNNVRIIQQWTLSNIGGIISKIELFVKQASSGGTPSDVDIHTLTQDFTEGTGNNQACAGVGNGCTWNTYNCVNSWATAGGDFNATIIDTLAITGGAHWNTWVLLGTGSTNPITATWGDTIRLLLKANTESASPAWASYMYSKENATPSNWPYLQITYTEAVAEEVIINNSQIM